ncbi:hypothetical protein [Streptomyces sp. NPDC008139]|uniref:hypothetical protein n=1 Tax=Streptomyces sp. NPDC008139 TaxID=3364814 RepID=UPI0036E534AA
MRKITRGAAVLAAAAATVTVLGATQAHAEGVHGCPVGAVCVYPGSDYNNDHPSLAFYSYGAHNLSGQLGTHMVVNNQYGGAKASLWSGYNGTGYVLDILSEGAAYLENLTPVNSISLDRP